MFVSRPLASVAYVPLCPQQHARRIRSLREYASQALVEDASVEVEGASVIEGASVGVLKH